MNSQRSGAVRSKQQPVFTIGAKRGTQRVENNNSRTSNLPTSDVLAKETALMNERLFALQRNLNEEKERVKQQQNIRTNQNGKLWNFSGKFSKDNGEFAKIIKETTEKQKETIEKLLNKALKNPDSNQKKLLTYTPAPQKSQRRSNSSVTATSSLPSPVPNSPSAKLLDANETRYVDDAILSPSFSEPPLETPTIPVPTRQFSLYREQPKEAKSPLHTQPETPALISLLDGPAFDEEESAASFAAARAAWISELTATETKSEIIFEPKEKVITSSMKTVEQPMSTNSSVRTSTPSALLQSESLICWKCFRRYYAAEAIKDTATETSHSYCSASCLNEEKKERKRHEEEEIQKRLIWNEEKQKKLANLEEMQRRARELQQIYEKQEESKESEEEPKESASLELDTSPSNDQELDLPLPVSDQPSQSSAAPSRPMTARSVIILEEVKRNVKVDIKPVVVFPDDD